nr:cell envelope integrity protein TolA [Motiliproteus sediminis]
MVLGVLVAGTWFEAGAQHRVQPFRHVKAELVDLKSQTRAAEEADRARQQEQARQAAEKKRAEAERKKQADARRKKEAAEKKQRAEAERKKKAEADQRQKKAAAEKKRKAELERKQQAEAKAKAEREAKLKAARAQAEAEAEAERAREAAERRQAEAARMEREAEAELQRIEAARQQEAVRRAAEAQVVASAVAVIRDGIQRNWRRPPSARNGMLVGVKIHLLPTGEVDDAYVVRSSGDQAFDRSAVSAVKKAERFPELQGVDPVLFDRNLRRINLEFRPEDLRL